MTKREDLKIVQDLLKLVLDVPGPSLREMGEWSDDELLAVEGWAAREAAAASDNDVRRLPKPAALAEWWIGGKVR